jgi:hypothetical protein
MLGESGADFSKEYSFYVGQASKEMDCSFVVEGRILAADVLCTFAC